ncbi:uncharacterized protein LOC107425185 isoform X3 [Ziziphus jujuba]|uniref:Uncharacterized protein LOC107425185 isoform X3 n=1 Tax=Ziziphus jujuba TaxID=326968 RepID=A0A6P4AWV0_ZIZJJ|nr:uncharacterized protein LOC107425185 isoform X3 [Ziziphus jujuba]
MKEATISNNLSSMASKPFDSDEGKPFIQGIMDESCGIPVGYSGFKLLKPSFDEVDRQCSIDILPLIFEEASCPKYPLDSSNAQDIYNISVLPQEGNNLQGASQLAFLSILEVPNPPKDQKSMDTYLNCQNCIDLQMNNADTYSSCIVDIKVEKESLQAPESNDEAVESLKNESVLINLQKVLQRQSSLKLEKTLSDRVHEIPNNRWRRCKRAASIDSRKILLLFSILSSFGTLILIYLTLRVRQSAESYVHA